MNKIKKIIVGIGIFISGLATKVLAVDMLEPPISMYAVDPGPRQTIGNTILKIGKIAVPIILFAIGLFVVLSKKITKRVKVIVVSTLAIVAILSVILMNYFSTMQK